MIAVAFAGHGAEHPGMGADLVEPDAPLVALAAARGGFDAGRLLRRGGPQLHRTAAVQPLLTAVNLTILAQLREAGLRWQLCLGHSLGELAAWAASGGLEFAAAVELGARRGQLLARLAVARPGVMLSLRGPAQADELADARPDELPAEAMAAARRVGVVDLAVHNAPGQWVVSGERAALATLLRGCAGWSGRFIADEGAWHSRMVAAGEPEFRAAIAAASPRAHTRALISNAGGQLLEPGAGVVEPFVAQLAGTVEWVACMRRLLTTAARELVLVGPSRALAGLVRDNLGAALDSGRLRVHRVEERRDLERVCELLT